MIPKVMLRKLYKKGSLKQDENEITFILQNEIYPATIVGLDPIKINEQDFDIDKIKVLINDDVVVNLAEVTKENPFKLTKGDTFTFRIEGNIDPGKHKIDFSFLTKEAGKIAFDVEEEF
ncbi:MAG: hypothetical protein KGD59_14210 [Candidatus Heimdallarchaeota archaeon]|nr:hypothetical protein [Candidatus Heimdallarchaeota archaeon]MBY8995701.1 hypothetical protein [Candidatus Heimdallarchaeota archaeon]